MRKMLFTLLILFSISLTTSSCEKSNQFNDSTSTQRVMSVYGMEGSVTIINTMLSGIQGQLDARNLHYETQSQEWQEGEEDGVAYQIGTQYLQAFWDDSEQKRDVIERDNWEE